MLVGEPIDVSDLLTAATQQDWSDDQLYSRIANRIGGKMAALKAQLDGQPLDLSTQSQLQQQVLEQGLDLYDPVDNAHRAQSLWERGSFRMQHREWAEHGIASAKAKLAAAAATLSRAASSSGGWMDAGEGTSCEAAVVGGGDEARSQGKMLAMVTDWLSPGSLCNKTSEYYSYQRSVAMMQLLQARV